MSGPQGTCFLSTTRLIGANRLGGLSSTSSEYVTSDETRVREEFTRFRLGEDEAHEGAEVLGGLFAIGFNGGFVGVDDGCVSGWEGGVAVGGAEEEDLEVLHQRLYIYMW